MALSKQDFIKQGFDAAQNTAAMTPGHEDSMPIFGMGTSWQAKAFAEGFRNGVTHRHSMKKETRPKQYGLVIMQSARKTAMLHVLSLHAEAGKACEAKDYSRVERIMCKVEKLSAKWGF